MKKFYSEFLSKKVLIVLLSFICVGKLLADTPVNGNQSGVWTKENSPYVITANVTIPAGQTLTIQPGVTVQFTTGDANTSQIIVLGTLKAVGNSTDSIKFYGNPYYRGSQNGPISITESSSNSELRYIVIANLGFYYSSDLGAALNIQSSTCTVSNCTFRDISGSAVYLSSSATSTGLISQNRFIVSSIVYYSILLDLDKIKFVKNNYSGVADSVQIGLTHDYDMKQNDSLYFGYDYTIVRSQTIAKTLTVSAGVYLYFFNGDAAESRFDVTGPGGKLYAVGAKDNYINFSGAGSFSYGVHAKGYSRGAQQGPIVISGGSSSVLQFVTIDNLGYFYNSDYTPAIIITKSSGCKITDCNILNMNGAALQIDLCTPDISNNTFVNDGLDVICDLDKLRYLKNNNPLEIGLTRGAEVGSDDTLTANNIFYRLLSSQRVPTAKTLVIEPGVEVQFPPSGDNSVSQLSIEGTIRAIGTSDFPINFTGGAFDRGTQRGPIIIETTSVNSVLRYVSISGLGYFYNNATTTSILIIKACCVVANCNITNNSGIAVNIQNASPHFTRNCIYTNVAGVLSTGGKAIFTENNFIGNVSYGVNNTNATDTINAQNCFWGDLSGPQQATTNPGGSGDIVSNNVLYNPFATEEYDCSENVVVLDCDNNTLPLILLNFQATLSNNTVNCSWQTASETNTSYFIIQRSTDGTNFSSLGKVYASGNSNINKSYSFIDKTPNNGINYYRLQMTDKDGKYSYSKTLPVNISIKQPIAIYPNPVINILYVQVQRNVAENVSLQVVDTRGTVVLQQNRSLPAGVTTLSINAASLAKGSYFIIVKGQTTDKRMFIKE